MNVKNGLLLILCISMFSLLGCTEDGDADSGNNSTEVVQTGTTPTTGTTRMEDDDDVVIEDDLPEIPDFIVGPDEADRFKSVHGLHTLCGIQLDDTLKCWGDNEKGQALAPTGAYSMVRVGTKIACAISTDSSVKCWGDEKSLAKITPTIENWKAKTVAISSANVCVINDLGAIQCAGDETFIGAGSEPEGQDWKKLEIADTHACAVNEENTMDCWGSDIYFENRKDVKDVKDVKVSNYKTHVLHYPGNGEEDFSGPPRLEFEQMFVSETSILYVDADGHYLQAGTVLGFPNPDPRFRYEPSDPLTSLVLLNHLDLITAPVCGLNAEQKFTCVEAESFREVLSNGEYLDEVLRSCDEAPMSSTEPTVLELAPNGKKAIKYGKDSFLIGEVEDGEMAWGHIVIQADKLYEVTPDENGNVTSGVLNFQTIFDGKHTGSGNIYGLGTDYPLEMGVDYPTDDKVGCYIFHNNHADIMTLSVSFEYK